MSDEGEGEFSEGRLDCQGDEWSFEGEIENDEGKSFGGYDGCVCGSGMER